MPDDHMELRKFVAPELIFGEGARHMAARYAKNFGASKALIVTDPGIMAAGWAEDVAASFEAAGIPYHFFADVTPNPRSQEVMDGARFYEREKCDTIVAAGGGSSIDCAKGIGIVSSNTGHILDFEGVDRIPSPGPPLICIPTTAGSSADVSQFAIITDEGRKVKIAIISKTVVPDVSLLDPVVLTTMDSDLSAYTGIDALTHAFEAFVSTAHSPITDLFSLEAVRLLAANLGRSIKEPDNLDLRSKTMMGSLYAGLAFSNASLGLVHAMAHSLGGHLDNPHGQCNAFLLDLVVEFNYEHARERYETIGEAFAGGKAFGAFEKGMTQDEKKGALLKALKAMKKDLNAELPFGNLGFFGRGDIAELARKAINDPCLATNPRRPSQKDIEDIYERALR